MAKKAVFFIHDMRCGGAQRVFAAIANGLAKRGWSIKIVVFEAETDSFFPLHPNVKIMSLGIHPSSRGIWGGIGKAFRFLKRLFKIRKMMKADAGSAYLSFITEINVYILIASLGLGRHVIVSERNDPRRKDRPWFWKLLQRMTYLTAYRVTANSSGVLELMRGYVPTSKLLHTPNSVAFPESNPDFEKRRPYLLTVARLHYIKGYDVLFRAVAELGAEFNPWRVRIIGEGDEKASLIRLAQDLGIESKIDWLGVTHDLSRHFNEASIFAVSSRIEGMPNAMMEAMSYSLPVIITDGSPGPMELVVAEDNGLIVPSEDHFALAAAIKRLIHDPDSRLRFGLRSKNMMEKYSEKNVVDLWEKTFMESLN